MFYRKFIPLIFLISAFFNLYGKDTLVLKNEKIGLIEEAYPDVVFNSEFDFEKNDWKIEVCVPDKKKKDGFRKTVLYLCGGKFLSEKEIKNKDDYSLVLYDYEVGGGPRDPATFTKDEIEELREIGSDDSRKNDLGTPMFLFDAIYDSKTKGEIEKHIITTKFLGHTMYIHERLKEPLNKVEKKIKAECETDATVQTFVNNVKSLEAYYWRVIAETDRRSFHSLGIAVDVLPKNYNWKAVYWNWTKQWNPDEWMITPLSQRWMPPQKVIDIFEEEGFIWGGKWAIWDNMHFEYHPELILMNSDKNK